MPTATGLSLMMDVAEPRILLERLITSADGTTWDRTQGSGYYIEPVNKTLMLAPLPTLATWATTFSGAYARYTKADYTLITPSAWSENHRRGAGDVYLEGFGATAGEVVTTIATLPVNRAVFISIAAPGTGSEKQVILECNWGVPGAEGSVGLRMFSDGNVAVFKGATQVGFYDLEGISQLGGDAGGRTKTTAQQTVDLMLIPCRRRELLVVSSWGPGFSHAFDDLDPSLINTITPAGHFCWSVPSGKPCVQFCLLPFSTSGTAYSPQGDFRYAPLSTQAFTATPAEDSDGTGATIASTYSLVDTALAPYVPGTSSASARIKAALTGDGTGSIFSYAVDVFTERTTTTTDDSAAFEMTPYLLGLSLDVPETKGASLAIKCKTPGAMETAGLASPATVGDRPIALTIPDAAGTGTIDVFRGTAAKPQHVAGNLDAVETLEWTATDREMQFELYGYRDSRPYDGHFFDYTISDVVKTPGFADADVDISADAFILPYNPGVSLGDFQVLQELSDTVQSFLTKLHQTYAATWLRGWCPTVGGYKFRFRDPATLSATPDMTIYEGRADAIAAGVSAAQVARRTVRTLREIPEPPECNQVIVLGYDRRTRKYVKSPYDDAASQDPTTAPSLRPSNWRGQVVSYRLFEPLIATQAAADRARDTIKDRLTLGRDNIEWTSDFLILSSTGVPIWKGDRVRIIKSGGTARGDYRVLSLKVDFEFEGLEHMPVRTATYTAQRIDS